MAHVSEREIGEIQLTIFMKYYGKSPVEMALSDVKQINIHRAGTDLTALKIQKQARELTELYALFIGCSGVIVGLAAGFFIWGL